MGFSYLRLRPLLGEEGLKEFEGGNDRLGLLLVPARVRVVGNHSGPVRGTITDISKDVLGYPSVTLNDAVVCEFPKGHESDLLALDKGQTVVIIGHVMGNNLGYTLMNKCVLAQ